MDDRPWDTWSKDKPMQPKALAGLLEPFGIRPRNQRTSPNGNQRLLPRRLPKKLGPRRIFSTQEEKSKWMNQAVSQLWPMAKNPKHSMPLPGRKLRSRALCGAPHAMSLPQVAPLVSSDDV
jgi:hypothetical protein